MRWYEVHKGSEYIWGSWLHILCSSLCRITQLKHNRTSLSKQDFLKLLSASFIPIHPLIAMKTVIVFSSWSHALGSLPMIGNVQKLTPDKHSEEAVSTSLIIAITWSYPIWPWCLVSYFCQTLLLQKFIQSSSNHCVSGNCISHIQCHLPCSKHKQAWPKLNTPSRPATALAKTTCNIIAWSWNGALIGCLFSKTLN